MDSGYRDILMRSGATIDGEGRTLHFGDAAAELTATRECCALIDRSRLTRLLATGPELLALLNRLSTGKLDDLAPGAGTPTVITTPKGRIVERLWVHQLGPDGVLMVGGEESAERVLSHLERYTFAERTDVLDVTLATGQLAIVGPRAAEILEAAGLPAPEPRCSIKVRVEGAEGHVLGHDGFSTAGYSIYLPLAAVVPMWQSLNLATGKCGGRATGELAADAWRILRGLPASGHELCEEYNPLEAGLYDAVSFEKGCYVGQEVVARLKTYDKVSRRLVGLIFPEESRLPAPPAGLYVGGAQVGYMTSATLPPGWDRPVALGYAKRKVAEPGTEVAVGGPEATLRGRMTPLPFSV